MRVQIVFDCSEVHSLCDFWADLLGYEIEADDAQIRQLIEAGYATLDDTVEIDGGLRWKTGAACHDPTGQRPRLYFQQVPEGKQTKNRVHLDLQVGDDAPRLIAHALQLGATKLWDGEQGPHTWVTLADPEGNEFCIG